MKGFTSLVQKSPACLKKIDRLEKVNPRRVKIVSRLKREREEREKKDIDLVRARTN